MRFPSYRRLAVIGSTLAVGIGAVALPTAAFADSCTTSTDYIGGYNTRCSDGTTAHTSTDYLGGYNTSYSDGASSHARPDYLGGWTTDYRSDAVIHTPPPAPMLPYQESSALQTLQTIMLAKQLEQMERQQPLPPPAPMPAPAVSANDRYSTSHGVMTSDQMQTELIAVGYSGPFDLPSLLAAYQRTTNSPVRPL